MRRGFFRDILMLTSVLSRNYTHGALIFRCIDTHTLKKMRNRKSERERERAQRNKMTSL